MLHLTIQITLIIYISLQTVTTTPIERRSIDSTSYLSNNAIPNSNNNGNHATKKDPFISRGWGAGGMPFSVLYMSPYSSKAPSPQQQPLQQQQQQQQQQHSQHIHEEQQTRQARPKNMAQLRMGGGGGARRKHYSVIPQLFVSYGWGPLGK